ncbi:ABC transporter permease [Paenibacillus sp. PCH8]|uniref:ABC transporter permease n=1 Tax=Paenibacillus sp. PCH8 TaxID=2066524 RepID=UPI0015E2B2F8|nr:ABC transporter permease [Paenibacillus sp. PCH8]
MKGNGMMSNLLKKINRGGIFHICLLYFFLSIMIVSISYYEVKKSEMDILGRSLYDENSIFFIPDESMLWDWRDINIGQQFTLFKELQTGSRNIRAIYFDNQTYVPQMVEGRFFRKEDFYDKEKLAVVGKEIQRSELKYKNGKLYYIYNNDEFEVIGTMGASHLTEIDKTILLSMNGLSSDENRETGIFVLSASDLSSVTKTKLLDADGVKVPIHLFERGEYGAQSYANSDIYNVILKIIVFVLVSFSSVIFTVSWIKKQRSEIRVLWILGYQPRYPLFRYVIKYFMITSFTYFLVAGGSFAILNINQEFYNEYFIHICFGFLVIVLTSFFSLRITMKSLSKNLIM